MSTRTTIEYDHDAEEAEIRERQLAYFRKHAPKIKPKPKRGRPKGPQPWRVACSCGAAFRPNSPGHIAHMEHKPHLCRRSNRAYKR